MYTGPNIVTSGLVLSLDAANVKSYPGSGTTWYDLSGNSKNATGVNTPVYSSVGIPHMDFTSNPTGSVGAIGNKQFTVPSTFLPVSTSFTIETWINRDSTSISLGDRESLFSSGGGAAGFRFGINSANTLYYLVGGTGGAGYSEGAIGSNLNITDGKWHQVGAIFDIAGTLGSTKVYPIKDGIIGTGVTISALTISMVPGIAGISYGCCSTYKGRLSKLSTYSRVLSANEILQNYNAHQSRFNL
jgi:hypothetical protein